MPRVTSKGHCQLCGNEFSKAAMTRHLKTCQDKKNAAAEAQKELRSLKVFHLLAEGRYQSEYWLHLSVPVAATLEKLDAFLRAIWLECCDHFCGKQAATQICTQCRDTGASWFCEPCAQSHECGDELMLPVVNSPRVGVCGYTG